MFIRHFIPVLAAVLFLFPAIAQASGLNIGLDYGNIDRSKKFPGVAYSNSIIGIHAGIDVYPTCELGVEYKKMGSAKYKDDSRYKAYYYSIGGYIKKRFRNNNYQGLRPYLKAGIASYGVNNDNDNHKIVDSHAQFTSYSYTAGIEYMLSNGLIVEGYYTGITGDANGKDYSMYGNLIGIAASWRFGKIEKQQDTADSKAAKAAKKNLLGFFKKSSSRKGISDDTESEGSSYQELRKQNRRIKPYKNAGENWYGNGWYAPTVNYGNTWFGN